MNIEPRLLFNFINGHEETGESAYDIWKSLGNDGDSGDFLDFLRFGKDGKTAYEYAKEGGFTGTEEEFAAKLNEQFSYVEVDKTLTQSDKAADAKTVGDKINTINTVLEDCVRKGDSVEVDLTIATEEEALAGTNDTAIMTPYKTFLVVQEYGGSGGGGGGGGSTIPLMSSEFQGGAFSTGDDIPIVYSWSSPNMGKGTLHVLVNEAEYATEEVKQGTNRFVLSGLDKLKYVDEE